MPPDASLWQRFRVKPGTLYAVSTLMRYAIIVLGVSAALSLLGIGWGEVQWLAAALGVGVGFGLREIVASFVAGLIILFERPVRVGDIVTLDQLSGTVTRIRILVVLNNFPHWDDRSPSRGTHDAGGDREHPVSVAEDPLSSGVLGTGNMLSNLDLLRKISLD